MIRNDICKEVKKRSCTVGGVYLKNMSSWHQWHATNHLCFLTNVTEALRKARIRVSKAAQAGVYVGTCASVEIKEPVWWCLCFRRHVEEYMRMRVHLFFLVLHPLRGIDVLHDIMLAFTARHTDSLHDSTAGSYTNGGITEQLTTQRLSGRRENKQINKYSNT